MRRTDMLSLLMAGASGCLDLNSLESGNTLGDLGSASKDMAMTMGGDMALTDMAGTQQPDLKSSDMSGPAAPWSTPPAKFTGTPLNAITGYATGGDTIFAAGNGGVVIVGDGKANTFAAAKNSAGNSNLNAVWATGTKSAMVVDQAGGVWATADQGDSAWTDQAAGATKALNAIIGRSASDIVVMGADTTNGRYYNGTWANAKHNTGQPMFGVWASATTWYAVGNGGYVATATDPTATWSSIKVASNPNLSAVWGVDDKNVWAVGAGGILAQYDGTAWTKSGLGGQNLNAIWGVSGTDIFAVGNSGTAYHYNGSTWSSISTASLSGYTLTGVWADGAGGVWVSAIKGADGYIFKY